MLTVGLIGAGRIGRVHASTISMHAHSKLVAVADVIEDNAQKLARDFGGQACTVDAATNKTNEPDRTIATSGKKKGKKMKGKKILLSSGARPNL